MPAASAKMSLRPSAIWRSSSMDLSRLRRSTAYRIGGAVQSAVEQLVLGGHAQAYRKKIRFTIVLAVTRGYR
jgi:hypothetical protein